MNNIQKYRKEKGIKQAEFADILNLTRPGLSYIENGNVKFIDTNKLEEMSDILNVSPIKLLGIDNLKYLPKTVEDIDYMIELLESLKVS